MPDTAILEAGRAIINVDPVLGGFLVLVLAALAWVVKTWRADVASLNARIIEEIAKREALVNAQIAELRTSGKIVDSVDDMRREFTQAMIQFAQNMRPSA
ncbi:hypothetical protein LH464_04490 [Neorhizobium sp. T786]|uniref:hypothetical protein n=1 Tax=Pseudorhizobium xiangyangii TaxID=2883104 RepID=UPI001CFFD24C|nr:hypothetical protein [Neorhizobium xiangyangii]MCB5201737.1 hypothetical protein [Neorhizobium xiangyangii]